MPANSDPRVLSIVCPHCGAAVGAYCWRAILPNREVGGVCWARVTTSGAPRLPDYRDAIR